MQVRAFERYIPLIRPADMNVHCFQKMVYNFEISYAHTGFNRLNMVTDIIR